MRRIDIKKFKDYISTGARQVDIAAGINEIMDFLEKNVTKQMGWLYKCKKCGHVTGYPGDLDCCDNPDFEVVT